MAFHTPYVKTGGGGGGGTTLTPETPAGALGQGTFTVVNTPEQLFRDGYLILEDVNYTYSAGIITITDGNYPTMWMESYYNAS